MDFLKNVKMFTYLETNYFHLINVYVTFDHEKKIYSTFDAYFLFINIEVVVLADSMPKAYLNPVTSVSRCKINYKKILNFFNVK